MNLYINKLIQVNKLKKIYQNERKKEIQQINHTYFYIQSTIILHVLEHMLFLE